MTIPAHDPLKVGTLAAILGDVAQPPAYKGTAGSGVNPLTKIIDIVALSETLEHDFCFATQRVSGSVLCPLYVPKGIHQSQPEQRKPVQTRLEDILPGRKPSAMFAEHPEARQQREEALRGS